MGVKDSHVFQSFLLDGRLQDSLESSKCAKCHFSMCYRHCNGAVFFVPSLTTRLTWSVEVSWMSFLPWLSSLEFFVVVWSILLLQVRDLSQFFLSINFLTSWIEVEETFRCLAISLFKESRPASKSLQKNSLTLLKSWIPWVTAETHSSSTATNFFKADDSNLSLRQSNTVSQMFTYICLKNSFGLENL